MVSTVAGWGMFPEDLIPWLTNNIVCFLSFLEEDVADVGHKRHEEEEVCYDDVKPNKHAESHEPSSGTESIGVMRESKEGCVNQKSIGGVEQSGIFNQRVSSEVVIPVSAGPIITGDIHHQ